MATTRARLFASFQRQVQKLNTRRKRLEHLFEAGQITREDIEYFYAASLVSAVNALEGLIEKLFTGFLTRAVRPAHGQRILVNVDSETIARDLLRSDDAYAAWLPLSKTITRGNRLFRNGGPFENLNQDDARAKHPHVIRNAIAHESHYALDKFRTTITDNVPVRPREKARPGAFLRTVIRRGPDQTRLEYYWFQLSSLAHDICK